MLFSRQAVVALVQALTTLYAEEAELLLYKHSGVRVRMNDRHPSPLAVVEECEQESLRSLMVEVAANPVTLRTKAPIRRVFDTAYNDLTRWLSYDGWIVVGNRLEQAAPAVEDTTGISDAFEGLLNDCGIDSDGIILATMTEAAESFRSQPPDYNGSTTKVRIVLETVARRIAERYFSTSSVPAEAKLTSSWGKALQLLREKALITKGQEDMLAQTYRFISPGAHIPASFKDEEWARLARTLALAATYFLLKTAKEAPATR